LCRESRWEMGPASLRSYAATSWIFWENKVVGGCVGVYTMALFLGVLMWQIWCFFVVSQGFIMKVNFNRAALAEALGLLTSVVPSRTPKPILRCVQITAGDKEARICATDLEVGISYTASEVQVDEPGEAIVPADRLLAIVRESVDDVLLLEAAEGTCQIRGADSHFTVYGHEPGGPLASFRGGSSSVCSLRPERAADMQLTAFCGKSRTRS